MTSLVTCLAGFAIVMTSVSATHASAQKANVFVSAGVVIANTKHLDSAMGLVGGLTVQKTPHHFTARGVALGGVGDDIIAEAGLLYGWTAKPAAFRATAATGLSLVTFDACPNDDDTCFALGVPLVIEFALSGKVAGVGVQGFANLNSKAMYFGIGGVLQLGWMP